MAPVGTPACTVRCAPNPRGVCDAVQHRKTQPLLAIRSVVLVLCPCHTIAPSARAARWPHRCRTNNCPHCCPRCKSCARAAIIIALTKACVYHPMESEWSSNDSGMPATAIRSSTGLPNSSRGVTATAALDDVVEPCAQSSGQLSFDASANQASNPCGAAEPTELDGVGDTSPIDLCGHAPAQCIASQPCDMRPQGNAPYPSIRG